MNRVVIVLTLSLAFIGGMNADKLMGCDLWNQGPHTCNGHETSMCCFCGSNLTKKWSSYNNSCGATYYPDNVFRHNVPVACVVPATGYTPYAGNNPCCTRFLAGDRVLVFSAYATPPYPYNQIPVNCASTGMCMPDWMNNGQVCNAKGWCGFPAGVVMESQATFDSNDNVTSVECVYKLNVSGLNTHPVNFLGNETTASGSNLIKFDDAPQLWEGWITTLTTSTVTPTTTSTTTGAASNVPLWAWLLAGMAFLLCCIVGACCCIFGIESSKKGKRAVKTSPRDVETTPATTAVATSVATAAAPSVYAQRALAPASASVLPQAMPVPTLMPMVPVSQVSAQPITQAVTQYSAQPAAQLVAVTPQALNYHAKQPTLR